MKKVHQPGLKDLFKYEKNLSEFTKVDSEHSIYNPFTFTCYLSILLIIIGPLNPYALAMGISVLMGLSIVYFLLKIQAKQIHLKRKIPESSVEKEAIKIRYTVINQSNLPLHNYSLIDYYTGDNKGKNTLYSPYPLPALRTSRLKMDWINDSGMGEKSFRNLQLHLHDSIGFFHFIIEEDKEQNIPIYPLIEVLSPIESDLNENSHHYGELDIQKRGESINFFGIRDYVKGDPVKRINWKQTAKQNRPIVNLFERNINKKILFLYNNALSLHSGYGAHSTEEYLKDIILSMASENISNGNQLQLITCEKSTPWGSQKTFINRLELFLMELGFAEVKQPEKFLEQFILGSNRESLKEASLFYFTPLLGTPAMESTFEELMRLSRQNIPIKIVAVDPYPYLDQYYEYGAFSGLKGHIAALDKLLKKWLPLLRANHIPLYVLKCHEAGSLNDKLNEGRRRFEKSTP